MNVVNASDGCEFDALQHGYFHTDLFGTESVGTIHSAVGCADVGALLCQEMGGGLGSQLPQSS